MIDELVYTTERPRDEGIYFVTTKEKKVLWHVKLQRRGRAMYVLQADGTEIPISYILDGMLWSKQDD